MCRPEPFRLCLGSAVFSDWKSMNELEKIPGGTSGLRPVRLSDREWIDAAAAVNPSDGCENCFATIFIWAALYGTLVMEWRGRAVSYNPSTRLMHFPMGDLPLPGELAELAGAFRRSGLVDASSFIYNVPPDYPLRFPEAAAYFDFAQNMADSDYLYSVSRLMESSGPKLRKKRNHIRQFLRLCPDFELVPMDSSNVSEAVDFALRVNAGRGVEGEGEPLRRAGEFFSELGLGGVILRCPESGIVAMSVFSPVNSRTYTVHFEKSLREADGAAQMIVLQGAAAIADAGGRLMNREQDMGLENLRRAKESLDPLFKYGRLRAYLRP